MTKAADKIKAIAAFQSEAQDDQADQPEQEQEPKTPGVKEQREALRAEGFKRCPTHLHYLERLPAASQTPVAGHEDDVSIRPLSEFSATTSACKACAKLREGDKRTERSGDAITGGAKRLAGLLRKRVVLQAKIDELQSTLSNAQQDAAEQLTHDEQR